MASLSAELIARSVITKGTPPGAKYNGIAFVIVMLLFIASIQEECPVCNFTPNSDGAVTGVSENVSITKRCS